MRRLGTPGFAATALTLTLAVASGCSRRPDPPPAVTLPIPQEEHKLAPWTWHRLGGLLVVEGEVDEPVDLNIKGRYLNEFRHAEFGPVRWEMYGPPPGEVAVLRTLEGKVLARWDFNAKPQRAASNPAPAKPLLRADAKPSPRPSTQPDSRLTRTASTTPMARELRPLLFPPLDTPAPKAPVGSRAPTGSRAGQAPGTAPVLPPPTMEPAPMPSGKIEGWPGSGEAFNLLRGPKAGRQICLTFDGGSSCEVAQEVLDALKERGLRTTFFLTGAFIRRFPDLVRRIAQEGHEIGNHTQNHPHLAPNFRRDPAWTKARFQQELLQADAALLQLLGRPMDPYWRAPYGEHTTELRAWAEELGYRHVGWSEGADTLDWATTKHRKLYRSGDAIVDRLRERMERRDGEGLIVLMHLGSERPVGDRPASVLAPFLDQAQRSGWRFVNIGAYMQSSGKPRWDPVHRLALLGPSASPLRTASKR